VSDDERFRREADERVASLTDEECVSAFYDADSVTATYIKLGLPSNKPRAVHDKSCKPLVPVTAGFSLGDVCVHAYTAGALARRIYRLEEAEGRA
jgi:hypothetical protein